MSAARAEPGDARGSAGPAATRLVPLLVLVASVGYLCRVDVTVIAPQLMAEFHLSQAQIGEVFSAFLLGYTVFQIPSGWLADRVGTRTLFLALTAGWAIVTAAHLAVGIPRWAMAGGALAGLVALRVLFGILAAPTYPAAGRAIALSVPAPWQGRANGAVLASIGIGSAVTPPLLGSIAARWGWRPALLGAAGLAAFVALIWGTLAPAGPSPRVAAQGPSGHAPESAWPSPLRRTSFWFLAASYTLQGYVGYVFVFWFYLYLVEVRHFDLLRAAWLASLPWLLTLLAIPLGGVASDWAVKRWAATRGRRSVPMVGLVLSAGLLALGATTRSVPTAVASLALSTALVLASEGPFWATMTQLSGPHSGTGGGVMNFGSNLGGAISPVATPWLAAWLGWGTALSCTALMAVAAALLWLGVEFPRTDTTATEGLP